MENHFNIANQSFHGISITVIKNNFGSFGSINVDNVGTIFWQLKIGRHLKRPVWKFPGGLSDEGESIGGFDLLSICSFIFGIYFTEYNHEDLKVVFLRC